MSAYMAPTFLQRICDARMKDQPYFIEKAGAGCRNRTRDLPLTRRLLYRLS